MRVLHVINNMVTGGAEKLLLDTLPIYNESGIKADLLVLNDDNYPFMKELSDRKCCNIFVLGKLSVYNPLNVFKIIPFLKRYEIVHVHLFPSQYWVAIAKLISFSKVKLVYTEHNTSSRRMRMKLFKIIDPFFYRPYKKIVCIAHAVKESVITHLRISPEKLVLIHNGVNINYIFNAQLYQKSSFFKGDNLKIIAQVSSFHAIKDQPTLIRAMVQLPNNIKLLLIGDGHLKQECISLAEKLGLTDRVLFLGVRTDVPELLKTADIIVLSSRYEGLSLASIEGMASGRPFIASDVPGLSEVIDGAGILFPYCDDQSLAKAILGLLEDNQKYNAVVSACLNRAKQFDIRNMADEHLTLYKKVVERHN
ncbi:MAG: glycosyltransferase [Flavobacterium sp.]|nr:MAG: glycosyltransferase [Flavobacterium sp.]